MAGTGSRIPLPESTVSLVGRLPIEVRHPGLQLDKFSIPGDQKSQKEELKKICGTVRDDELFANLFGQRALILENLSAITWTCQTTGSMTLHLSRASAFENAGICLHPLYGFVYLPGPGLKGMARAYAETIWLQGEADKVAGWQKIEAVFGWSPNSDSGKRWKPTDALNPNSPASSGSIIFHDAWPEKWPKLELDIINNHHKKYYEGKDSKDAPGDWEAPNMVYFLCIGADNNFSFALSKRSQTVADSLLECAKEWLTGALVHLGAGAKTNAGYGCFKPIDSEAPTIPAEARSTFETTLELVTPAFLAGANQQAEDCDLRPATLRGQLRWWWRTMHSGYVDVETLRKLEAVVWGDTEAGGAARITIEHENDLQPVLYDYKDRYKPKYEFQRDNMLERPPNNKTTQGLFYLSFGMDDANRKRWYVTPGKKWNLKISARSSTFETKIISPDQIRTEVKNSLWLLCYFGGVGSKARNGFGSFCDPKELSDIDIEKCKEAARAFRSACSINHDSFDKSKADSPSIEQMLEPWAIQTPWKNYWFTLDQLGFAVQAFAKEYKHNVEKKALGMPRRIGNPITGSFNAEKGDRHASPVFYHLDRGEDDCLILRITAFPAKYLPDLEKSRAILEKLLEHLKGDLELRVKNNAKKGLATAKPSVSNSSKAATQRGATANLPKPGDCVEAVLAEEKTKRGGWKATYEPSGLPPGVIQNSDSIPSDKKPGDRVELIVAFCKPKEIAFKWPTNE